MRSHLDLDMPQIKRKMVKMYLSVDVACDSAVFLVGQFGFDPLKTCN